MSLTRSFAINDEFLKPGKNSIGFLRLLLASLVVVEHSFTLGGFPIPGHMYARLAVAGFFFLSGMLIAQSFVHSSSVIDFGWRRLLRLFPGLWACVAVMAFILLPIAWFAQYGSLGGYFDGPGGPFAFFGRGLALFGGQASVHGVFAHTPVGDFSNGSLWTLPVELLCYAALAIMGLAGIFRRWAWALWIPFLLVLFFHLFPNLRFNAFHEMSLPSKLTNLSVLELYVFFSLGMLAYIYRERIRVESWLGILCCVFVVGIMVYEDFTPTFQFASRAMRVFALPYALLWLANVIPLRSFDRKRDLSYGTYIYAFPIQQTMVTLGAPALGPWAFLAISYSATIGFAFASWHLIEQPALRLKRLFASKKRRVGDEEIATDPS